MSQCLYVLLFSFSTAGFYRLSSHNTRAIVPSMSSFSAPSLVACAIQCTQDSLCFAFNFMKISSGTLSISVTCELLKYDTFDRFQDLIPMLQQKVNWTVYFLTLWAWWWLCRGRSFSLLLLQGSRFLLSTIVHVSLFNVYLRAAKIFKKK